MEAKCRSVDRREAYSEAADWKKLNMSALSREVTAARW